MRVVDTHFIGEMHVFATLILLFFFLPRLYLHLLSEENNNNNQQHSYGILGRVKKWHLGWEGFVQQWIVAPFDGSAHTKRSLWFCGYTA